jgi:hypothetical protein
MAEATRALPLIVAGALLLAHRRHPGQEGFPLDGLTV